MKAILVIDINDELYEDYENFYVDYDLRAERKGDNVTESIRYVEDCPLKPLPQRKWDRRAIKRRVRDLAFESGFREDVLGEEIDEYATGFNACMDEILGARK